MRKIEKTPQNLKKQYFEPPKQNWKKKKKVDFFFFWDKKINYKKFKKTTNFFSPPKKIKKKKKIFFFFFLGPKNDLRQIFKILECCVFLYHDFTIFPILHFWAKKKNIEIDRNFFFFLF